MKVQYDEDLTSHIGLEPCGAFREECGEASAEECTGQPLSHETSISDADIVLGVEGNTAGSVIVSTRPVRRGQRTWHVHKLFVRETGDLTIDHRLQSRLVRGGKARSRNRR